MSSWRLILILALSAASGELAAEVLVKIRLAATAFDPLRPGSPAACPAPDQLTVTDRSDRPVAVVNVEMIEDQPLALAIVHTPGPTDGCMIHAALRVSRLLAENLVRDGDECTAITAARISKDVDFEIRRDPETGESRHIGGWPPPSIRRSDSGNGSHRCANYLAGVERRFLTPRHSKAPRIAAGLRTALKVTEGSPLRKAVILTGPLCDAHTYEGDASDTDLVVNAIAENISIEALFMQSATPSGLLDSTTDAGAARLRLYTKETGGTFLEVNLKTALEGAAALMKGLRRQCEVTVSVPGQRAPLSSELRVRSKQQGVARIVRVGR